MFDSFNHSGYLWSLVRNALLLIPPLQFYFLEKCFVFSLQYLIKQKTIVCFLLKIPYLNVQNSVRHFESGSNIRGVIFLGWQVSWWQFSRGQFSGRQFSGQQFSYNRFCYMVCVQFETNGHLLYIIYSSDLKC